MLNTIKTVIGYAATMVSKYTPVKFEKSGLSGIYNYLPISNNLTTSGQPTEKQFHLIKQAGFDTVINLAPHGAENSLPDEAALLTSIDLKYIHIPVNFQKPSDRKFALFVEVMEQHKQDKVWLHCAANMRVSAFLYRYRLEVLKDDPENALRDLEKIWVPLGIWKSFIGED